MGDGPGYDHMYAEMEKRARSRINDHQSRYDGLRAIASRVGFGNSADRHPTSDQRFDGEIHDHLQRAYDLLSLILRAESK